MTTATITITARDLDTDERSVIEVETSPPTGLAEQRTALMGAVRNLRPSDRMRSFANGAATFIDRQHLVVAVYSRLPKGTSNADSAVEQASLFDEAA